MGLRRKRGEHLPERPGWELASAAAGFYLLSQANRLGDQSNFIFNSYHPSRAFNIGKVPCERVIRRKCLGSGDPPGLQNRRSSLTGDGVFDSHALPPTICPPAIAQGEAMTASLLKSKCNPAERIAAQMTGYGTPWLAWLAIVLGTGHIPSD